MTSEFVSAVDIHEIPEGSLAAVEVLGIPIAVANIGGVFHAFDEKCTHEQCSLVRGELAGTTITCMCHGAEFDVRTGEVLAPPASLPLKTYRTKVDGSRLLIEV